MPAEKGQKEDEDVEPDEVRVAREEMHALQDEKDRTDTLKSSVLKELLNAKDKASKIEQVGVKLPFRGGYRISERGGGSG